MSFRLAIILYASSFFPIPSFGQTDDSVSVEFESAVDALLEEYYGKLSPDIIEIMADSGAFSKDGVKSGRWIDYSFKSCILCDREKIDYDSLIKRKNSQGNISFIKDIGEYNDGNRQGTWYSFSTDRLSKPFDWTLASKVDYINNNKEGWEKKYISNDSDLYEFRRIFYKNGIENGPVYGFNENGDTTLIGQNKSGRPNGLFKVKEDAILGVSFDRMYVDGVQTETIFYHKNGVVSSRGLFIDYRPHGVIKNYNEEGLLVLEENFNFGIPEGKSTYYYEDGNVEMTRDYSKNGINCNSKYYHTNGQLWSELEMKSGKPWTIIGNFDKAGKTKDKGNLKNGNGTMKRYDENGKLISIDHFKNGELIKEQSK